MMRALVTGVAGFIGSTLADKLVAEIPGARRVVIPDAGHMAPMEAPAAVSNALLAFLAEVG